MAGLEFKYSAEQPHQVAAIDAVCDLFRGQEFVSGKFTAHEEMIDFGGGTAAMAATVGYANGLHV